MYIEILIKIFSCFPGQRNAKRNLLSSDGKTLPALKNAGIQEHYNERDNKLASRPVSVILPVVSKVSSL